MCEEHFELGYRIIRVGFSICMSVSVYVCVCVRLRVCTFACVYVRVCVRLRVYIRRCLCCTLAPLMCVEMSLRRVTFFSDRKSVGGIPGVSVGCACADGSLWVGTCEGTLMRFDVGFNVTAKFELAFGGKVTSVCSSKQAVVAMGQMSDGSVRVSAYHLYRTANGAPALVGSVRVPADLGAVCVDVAIDFSMLAVGCANGQTLIYSGNTFGRPGVKPRFFGSGAAISGVKFASLGSVLFISSPLEITSVRMSDMCVLNVDSTVGGELVSVFENNLIVAKNEAIYTLDAENGNISVLPVEVSVSLLRSWKTYFAYLVDGNMLQVCYSGCVSFLALVSEFDEQIVEVCVGAFDGNFIVVIGTSNVWIFREKRIEDQIEALVGKSLFEWAIQIAKNLQDYPCREIYKQFGDSLFDREDFDSSISVFIRSIDEGLESSYVVNNFLQSGKVKHVVEYLEAWIKAKGGIEHSHLLVLCYRSLSELEKVTAFTKSMDLGLLIKLLAIDPTLVALVDPSDIYRALKDDTHASKSFLVSLVDSQEMATFDKIVPQISESILLECLKNPTIKCAILQFMNKTGWKFVHGDLCNLQANPQHVVKQEESPDLLALLSLQLENALSSKSQCRQIVAQMIQNGWAKEALIVCKLFGAPASVILPITAALNLPYEALAYPAMSLQEVNAAMPLNPNMLMNAVAIARRAGSASGVSPGSVSLLLETAIDFGSIKGRLIGEFSNLEKSIEEKRSRTENDRIEIVRMKSEINWVKRKPIVHQLGRPCATCKLPNNGGRIVLFRCMHAHHAECLSSSGCTVCQSETKHHNAILNQRKLAVNNHDELFKKMAQGDKFNVAMTYLGHGLFE